MVSQEPSFVPRPIQTSSAAQQIADQLRMAVLLGQLPPGRRLPSEADLAAEYAVSRGTIRETMKLLSAAGLAPDADVRLVSYPGSSLLDFLHPKPSSQPAAASLPDVLGALLGRSVIGLVDQAERSLTGVSALAPGTYAFRLRDGVDVTEVSVAVRDADDPRVEALITRTVDRTAGDDPHARAHQGALRIDRDLTGREHELRAGRDRHLAVEIDLGQRFGVHQGDGHRYSSGLIGLAGA